MKKIIINEHYKGVYKEKHYYRIDEDIIECKAHIIITIPLYSTKSIMGGVIEAKKAIKAKEWIEAGKWIQARESIEAGETIIAGKWIKAKEWIKAKKWIEAGETIKAGDTIEAKRWIKAKESIKTKKLIVFGHETLGYLFMHTNIWTVYISDTHIQIGCQLHTIKEWQTFTDEEISKMDDRALEWWKQWKKFIFSTHKNLPRICNIEDNL